MENLKSFIVVSKLNNLVKIISAVDKHHAVNKALMYFENHCVFNLKVLKKISDAKKG